MSNPIATSVSQSSSRAGLCPHGLPPSACPVCSGGGMSGAGKAKDKAPATKPQNNQWSWMKCYAVGMAMKANANRAENAKNAFERQIEYSKQLGKNIQEISDKIKNAITNIQKALPQTAANIIQNISNVLIFPMLNLIAQIPKIIEKFAQLQQNMANFLQQAGEKFTAILADLKKFIDKTLTKNVKKIIKKFFLFFTSNIEDENYSSDDTLAVFKSRELRKFLSKIINPKKKRNENAARSTESEQV